jgi:hypothetical protein
MDDDDDDAESLRAYTHTHTHTDTGKILLLLNDQQQPLLWMVCKGLSLAYHFDLNVQHKEVRTIRPTVREFPIFDTSTRSVAYL